MIMNFIVQFVYERFFDEISLGLGCDIFLRVRCIEVVTEVF